MMHSSPNRRITAPAFGRSPVSMTQMVVSMASIAPVAHSATPLLGGTMTTRTTRQSFAFVTGQACIDAFLDGREVSILTSDVRVCVHGRFEHNVFVVFRITPVGALDDILASAVRTRAVKAFAATEAGFVSTRLAHIPDPVLASLMGSAHRSSMFL